MSGPSITGPHRVLSCSLSTLVFGFQLHCSGADRPGPSNQGDCLAWGLRNVCGFLALWCGRNFCEVALLPTHIWNITSELVRNANSPSPQFLNQKFRLKHSHLPQILSGSIPQALPRMQWGQALSNSLSFLRQMFVFESTSSSLNLRFFPAPGDTPSRDFWFRGNWNYLNGFSFKAEKYVWEINKKGGRGWRTDLTFHKTFLLIKSLRL